MSEKLNRRRFIQQSVAASAAASLGLGVETNHEASGIKRCRSKRIAGPRSS